MEQPTKRVMLDEGRWTMQRPGDSPSQAMNRLAAGDGEPNPRTVQEWLRFLFRTHK